MKERCGQTLSQSGPEDYGRKTAVDRSLAFVD